MPYTPYHFGPSGFIGLVFRKWIDLPVFVLANVIIDIEVLLWDKFPYHRYVHTLLFGAAAGVVWGIAAYLLRNYFERAMRLIHIPYKACFWKMVISGVLGIWLHIVIDAIYHPDVRLFWPTWARPLWRLLSCGQLKAVCLAFWLLAIAIYIIIAASNIKRNKAGKSGAETD